MSNIYETMREFYPELELKGGDEVPQAYEPYSGGSHDNRARDLDRESFDAKAHVQGLPPLENNRWMRALNKITSSMVAASVKLMEGGGFFMFAGAHRGVGTTTVSYYTARLLSTDLQDQRGLFITLLPKSGDDGSASLLLDLLEERVTAKDVLSSLGEGNFHHLTIEMDQEFSHAPVLPSVFEDFLSEAKDQYRWVVIDSPPIEDVPLMFPLSRMADGVVIVARAGVTRLPALNALAGELEQMGGKLLGVVLNYRRYPIPGFLMRLL